MEIIELATTQIGLRRFKDIESGTEVYFPDDPFGGWEAGLITDLVKQAFIDFEKQERENGRK